MDTLVPRYSAYMLIRGQGEIIFASPTAVEQAAWMTGAAPGGFWTLEEILRALFPIEADLTRAQAQLDRALALVRRGRQLHLFLEIPVPDLRPGFWDLHLALKPDAPTETFLLSFRPRREAPARDRGQGPAQALRQGAAQARAILDRALLEADLPDPMEGPLPEGLGGLVALVDRARGLLGSLEAPPANPLPGEASRRIGIHG
jgi:hypothetical protein